ncbi:MAG TPA: Mut7-C RNAse domain-containing protein [Candidatus Babeliales bacterium]|nr:Mut7-C RNAse domain-containing protein [Candidatus Babeliales bacterium]
MKPFKVRLRFHGDLNLFVGSKTGVAVIERQLAEKTSIKDIIESCGVPHPEVDLILVDDQTVGFDYTLARDAEVEVFSVENCDTDYTEKRLQTIGIRRFVSDGHMGGLTRTLRLLGFDVAYPKDADDRQLLEVMSRENRALLTRDRRLLMHRIVQHGYYPRSQNTIEQTIEVVRRFDLSKLVAPFTRCLRCNALLEEATKADVIEKLEPLTKIYYNQFRHCPVCKQIYWPGSHFPKLKKRIEEILSRAQSKA